MGQRVLVVGAGIFGVSAALELRARAHDVTLIDPGPIPHPLAESTDISKIVRLDYGDDTLYTSLMERAIDRWRAWNASWSRSLFHETGLVFLSRAPLAPGGFEYESQRLLEARGHRVEPLDRAAIARRFPAWSSEWVDGYFNPTGGYAESGLVVSELVRRAKAEGVVVREGERIASLSESDAKVTGVRTARGEQLDADVVVVAAGSWTADLVPSLASLFRTVGQPVFHLRPADASHFEATWFPVFGADIARTGYYGFCANRDGIVKIANHGAGRSMHPDSSARVVTAVEQAALRAFVASALPSLADAPIVATRVCVYSDTQDEHFVIARDPEREGLVVASGGSGHGFKFGPIIGELVADAVEGAPGVERFRWRTPSGLAGEEQARHRG